MGSIPKRFLWSGSRLPWHGGCSFANVVMLLVAAGVLPGPEHNPGFIQSLISIATSFGSASIILDDGAGDPDYAGGNDYGFR